MITLAQMDFAGDLSNVAQEMRLKSYFPEMISAIEAGDCVALAKFSALLIIELSQHGAFIAHDAAKWIQLFGELPEFDLLTQNVHSV